VWGWQAECTPSDRVAASRPFTRKATSCYHGDTRLSRDNWAFSARVQYSPARHDSSLWLGYRDFRPYFAPPGYWGRIGYWHNPTDLRGIDAGYTARIGSVAVDARTEASTPAPVKPRLLRASAPTTRSYTSCSTRNGRLDPAGKLELSYEGVPSGT
jgi:hypothetical protein